MLTAITFSVYRIPFTDEGVVLDKSWVLYEIDATFTLVQDLHDKLELAGCRVEDFVL